MVGMLWERCSNSVIEAAALGYAIIMPVMTRKATACKCATLGDANDRYFLSPISGGLQTEQGGGHYLICIVIISS